MHLFRSRRGLGCKFGAKGGITTYGVERLGVGGGAGLPSEFSLEYDGLPILNQGPTSSCVAHAFAGAIHVSEHHAGLPFAAVSRRFIYDNARAAHSPKVLGRTILTDDGTYLHSAADGLRALGAPDESKFPWDPSRINRLPTFTAFRGAYGRAGGKYARLRSYGAARLDELRATLQAGLPVAFGTRVSNGFLDDRGLTHVRPPMPTDSIAGNHAMLIVGWKTDTDGLWFRVINSWGVGWRDSGKCWMHESYITDPFTNDLHAIAGWHRLQGSA